jgi:hypothetical protein
MSDAMQQRSLSNSEYKTLCERWLKAWPKALDHWSRFTRLQPPLLCASDIDAKKEGLATSFAMIRLQDQAVVINLADIVARGLDDYAVEVLAHEIGHHVLAPATLADHARMIARMCHALPIVDRQAPLVANLYTDLLINNRLQRSAELRMDEVYKLLHQGQQSGPLWSLYMRIYELLWSLERGSLGGQRGDDRQEGDAILAVRILRSYAHDWLDGAGRFAALLMPYLLEEQADQEVLDAWFDTKHAAVGGNPAGLTEIDPGEIEGAIHPARDPDLMDRDAELEGDDLPEVAAKIEKTMPSGGQARDPFGYKDVLRAAGFDLSADDIAVGYYKERAQPHLVPFPTRTLPAVVDPLPEGVEPWEVGDSFDDLDWMQSVLQSPEVIPGVTTVQRAWGNSAGSESEREPLYLDIYVDSSGSMPAPRRELSYLTLAGAIISLSALRAGALVQVTLWSGKHQIKTTDGFIRDETQILKILTGHFGSLTAFPIPTLRETYLSRRKGDHPVHILVISDDGVDTMFDEDEQGNSGWDIAAMALDKAAGGGTLVLNMPNDWDTNKDYFNAKSFETIAKARDTQGWNVFPVSDWEGLVAFAREFSRKNYM